MIPSEAAHTLCGFFPIARLTRQIVLQQIVETEGRHGGIASTGNYRELEFSHSLITDRLQLSAIFYLTYVVIAGIIIQIVQVSAIIT